MDRRDRAAANRPLIQQCEGGPGHYTTHGQLREARPTTTHRQVSRISSTQDGSGMTLALYGKSRRRQGTLLLLALFAVLAGIIGGAVR